MRFETGSKEFGGSGRGLEYGCGEIGADATPNTSNDISNTLDLGLSKALRSVGDERRFHEGAQAMANLITDSMMSYRDVNPIATTRERGRAKLFYDGTSNRYSIRNQKYQDKQRFLRVGIYFLHMNKEAKGAESLLSRLIVSGSSQAESMRKKGLNPFAR